MAKKRRAKREKQLRRQRDRAQAQHAPAAEQRPFPDPRLFAVPVEAVGGVPVAEATYIFPVDRLRLDDNRVLAFHLPNMPAFYLVTAKALRDNGERERQETLATVRPATERTEWADVNVADHSLAMDALGKLASAVVLAAAAVEAYANDAIERLDEAETVEVERRGEQVQIPQAEMVRKLRLEEKLDLAVPKATGRPSFKAREPWPRFRKLSRLRDEVVHLKPRGQTDDPDVETAMSRLFLGEGSTCVEDGAAVILACEPDALSDATKAAIAAVRTAPPR